MDITIDQLLAIVPELPELDREAQLEALNMVFKEFAIDSPIRVAMFLAQLAHESGGFKYRAEIWGPTPAQRRYDPPSELARTLGNRVKGDGLFYKGRGLIQLTGRNNYVEASRYFGLDLINHPELVEGIELSTRIAGWFWQTHGLNEIADRGDSRAFRLVTKRINGGYNGLSDRVSYFKRAKQALGLMASKEKK